MVPKPRILVFILVLLPTLCISQNWHSIGPSAIPVSMCISSSGHYMLVGTLQSGVARSTDGGQTWEYAHGLPQLGWGNLPSYTVSCLQQDPTNPQIVFAGIGPDETATGHGIYKSTDGGINWEAKNTGLPQWSAIRNIAVNPFDPKEVFIYCRVSSGSGIYRTTNSGNDWSLFFQDSYLRSGLLFNKTDSTMRYAIGIDGTIHQWKDGIHSAITSSTNFFSTGFPKATFVNSHTGSLFYIHAKNIYRQTAESSWVSLLSDIEKTGYTITAINRGSIEETHGTIFVSTDLGVFKSHDDGMSWSLLEGMQDLVFASDSQRVIGAGLTGVYVSDDGGVTWTRAGEGPRTSAVCYLSRARSAGSEVLYTIAGSVMKSTDDGASWTRLRLPNSATPSIVRANPFDANIVYVGCGAFYASYFGMYKSRDGGTHWEQIFPDSSIPVTAMDIDPRDTSRVIAGTPGVVYESTNSGRTWEALLTITGSTHYETNVVEISRSNPATIFAGVTSNSTYEAGMFVTSDSGYYWERRVKGLPEGLEYTGITAVETDPTNENIVYMGNSAGVFKSTNKGELWEWSGVTCLYDGFVNDIKMSPDNPNFLLVAVRGTQIGRGGLFNSTDGGASWSEISFPGLPDTSRTFLDIVPQGNTYKVYVGTLSYGWLQGELPRITSAVKDPACSPAATHLAQNYPNPFNPETMIGYRIRGPGFRVRLAVYDVLGREVAVLMDERKEAGSYQVKFDGTNLPSGVYFYRMQAGDFVQTRQLLLLK
jgi:photosystem II stability/assembly factor-like uncharacterized protein